MVVEPNLSKGEMSNDEMSSSSSDTASEEPFSSVMAMTNEATVPNPGKTINEKPHADVTQGRENPSVVSDLGIIDLDKLFDFLGADI